MRTLVPIVLLALAACTPPPGPGLAGNQMTDFFTFATGAQESWEYINTDSDISYVLHASLSDVVETTEEGLVYSINWSRECRSNDDECIDGDLHTVQWRVDTSDGVFIPGLAPGNGAPLLDFAPDVQIALAEMDPGDTVETVSAGFTFTGTYVGYAECPVFMSVDWGDDCVELTLTDGDENPETNPGVTGTYWMIPGFDFVAYQGEADSGVWELAAYECVGSDC